MPTINRHNFDRFWLSGKEPPGGHPSFRVVRLLEAEGSRQRITEPLLSAIYDHHIHPDRIAGALQRLGYAQAARALLERLPKDDRTRKGNFGEVVASEHLRQRHGYAMPVFKLRYSDNPAMPLRGEDLIAFELNDRSRIVALCIGEAKVRTAHTGTEVQHANSRLQSAYHPYPVALSLISTVLHDQGQHELADQVDSLMETLASQSFPRHNWIFLISERGPDDPFGSLTAEEHRVENLTCVHIELKNLHSFVSSLFETPLPGARQ